MLRPILFRIRTLSEDDGNPEPYFINDKQMKKSIVCYTYYVPRLGIKGLIQSRGFSWSAYSGPANWAVKGQRLPNYNFPHKLSREMWALR